MSARLGDDQVAAFHMLRDNVDYIDLGGDWFSRRQDTDKRRAWQGASLCGLLVRDLITSWRREPPRP